jgi:hypothetical protein
LPMQGRGITKTVNVTVTWVMIEPWILVYMVGFLLFL